MVGPVAMAFAICSGIVAFEFYTRIIHPALPLDGGTRIVGSTGRAAEADLDSRWPHAKVGSGEV